MATKPPQEVPRSLTATQVGVAVATDPTFSERDPLKPVNRESLSFKWRHQAIRDEVTRMDFVREHALRRIREEQPAWVGVKLVRTAALLLGPDSAAFDKLRGGAYDGVSRTGARLAAIAIVFSYAAVLLLGAAGIAATESRALRLLPLLVLGGVAGVHLMANATAGFRLPWMPLLVVYASHAALWGRALPARLGPRARTAWAALLLVFLGVGVPYFFVYQRPLDVWNAGS